MTTNRQLQEADKELDRYLSVGIAQVEEERDRYKAECEALRTCLAETAGVAVTMLYESHKADTIKEFTVEQLSQMVETTKHLADANVQVEKVYRKAWDMAQECGCCGQTVKCDPDCDAVILRKSDQQPAPQTEMLDDDSLARQIGEIGNKIHNLGCEHQNDEGLADRLAEIAHQAWMLQRSVMVSKQQPAPDVAGLEMVDVAQDGQYPPCDFCGATPDHHPWHGSGMLKGVDSPHIHACNGCRHLLPSRAAPDVTQLVEALKASTHRLHEQAEGEDDCRCSQCRFVRLRDAALAAYRNQGGDT